MRHLTFWLTGLPASGKTTLGSKLCEFIASKNLSVVFIDGDEVRKTLCSDLGFSPTDRMENIRRVASMAKIINTSGSYTICCFVSPYNELRTLAKNIIGVKNFVEIYVDTPVEECINRDPKGLYEKALKGEIADFTGVSAPYEIPLNPDILIINYNIPIEESCKLLFDKTIEIIEKKNKIILI